jgi:type II secretory pathway pseudopilin PulG
MQSAKLQFKIKNLKETIRYMLYAIPFQRGFTLIELLVTIGVLMVVGVIISAILYSSLRGAASVVSITSVRQNGNYAITQMTKMLRYTQRFDGVSTSQAGIYSCDNQPGAMTPTPIPMEYKFLKITGFDNQETIFACGDSTDSNTIASISANQTIYLINTSEVVTNGACHFTCTTNSNGTPTVGIEFTLNQAQAKEGFFENQASILFKTSITPRNLY